MWSKISLITILVISYSLAYADQTLQCGEWNTYKDEKCYKIFEKELQTYSDALNTCYQNEGSSLMTINSQEEQEFLLDLLRNKHNVLNDIWIGGQYKENHFKWSDNLTVNFTNWANSFPVNESGYECVKISVVAPYNGKWLNEPCNQKNLVVCEKMQNWLFSYLQKTVMEMRETITNLTQQLENTKRELQLEIIRKSSETTPTGTIAYFCNTTAPIGWLKANGQLVSRTVYANLFATIGTAFGSGDGSTTFTLPDLRGEFVRGWSDGRDADKNRVFASFQWGSSIPFASYINNQTTYAAATAYRDHWGFSGSTFDSGYHYIGAGDTREGISIPNTNDTFQNEIYYVSAPNRGFITSWVVLMGTRPRNVALLACIKH